MLLQNLPLLPLPLALTARVLRIVPACAVCAVRSLQALREAAAVKALGLDALLEVGEGSACSATAAACLF